MKLPRRRFLEWLGLGAAGLSIAASAATPTSGPKQQRLRRSTPETQGIASAGILQFLAAAAASKIEFHSLMVARHGQVVTEGWWVPYRPEAVHLLYSLTKSFTSTAVDFAVSEGKLTVDDPVTRSKCTGASTNATPRPGDLPVRRRSGEYRILKQHHAAEPAIAPGDENASQGTPQGHCLSTRETAPHGARRRGPA